MQLIMQCFLLLLVAPWALMAPATAAIGPTPAASPAATISLMMRGAGPLIRQGVNVLRNSGYL